MTPVSRYMTPEEDQTVLRLRRKGLRIEDIARDMGRSDQAIRRALSRLGVPRQRLFKIPAARQKLLKRITALALQGIPERQAAEQLGITPHVLSNCVCRYDLMAPYMLTSTQELADDLGLSQKAIQHAARTGKLAYTPWFAWHMFTPEQVDAVKAHYSDFVSPEVAATWLSTEQTAREFGLSAATLSNYLTTRPEFAGVIRCRVSGRDGRCFRFEPYSVRAALRLFKPRLSPAQLKRQGCLSTKVLADLLGVSITTLSHWARRGAPHERDKNGHMWFAPDALASWLEARPKSRHYAANLRPATTQERAA